jgi:hypothetical protein
MIDLDKEFRTLRLLASVFMILGAGLTLGGFGLAALMADPAMNENKRKPMVVAVDATPLGRSKSVSQDEYKEKFAGSLGQTGMPMGILGVLMVLLGLGLRWIIREQTDDGNEAQSNPELFRAYAAQLVVAEQKKAKNKKSPQ